MKTNIPIASSSLFHFTNTINGLRGILQKGFRFSFSLEHYPASIIHNNISKSDYLCEQYFGNKNYQGVAIPMVCFCDTPIGIISNHANRYGQYFIGIDRNIASTLYNNIINPLIYVSSSNIWWALSDISIAKALAIKENPDVLKYNNLGLLQLCPRIKTEEEYNIFLSNLIRNSNMLLGLAKPERGYDLSKKEIHYYEEREWRAFWPDNDQEETNWIWNFNGSIFRTKDEFRKWITPYNIKLWGSDYGYLPLTKEYSKELLFELITHIVVKFEKQVRPMVEYINNMPMFFGIPLDYDNSYDSKLKRYLISRVTSYERLQLDY